MTYVNRIPLIDSILRKRLRFMWWQLIPNIGFAWWAYVTGLGKGWPFPLALVCGASVPAMMFVLNRLLMDWLWPWVYDRDGHVRPHYRDWRPE